jgi:predicted NBD/HSP70 family sugar kinase
MYTVKYMFLAIAIGVTKTLTALFDENGKILAKNKIATNSSYGQFSTDLQEAIKVNYQNHEITHCCCAVPGTIDFANGIALAFGSEDWRNVPVVADVQSILPRSKVLIHNDAKLPSIGRYCT